MIKEQNVNISNQKMHVTGVPTFLYRVRVDISNVVIIL